VLNLSLFADQTLVIESAGVILRGVQPVLNGVPLEGWVCEVIRSDHEQLELRYTCPSLGDGVFGLKATPPDALRQIWMQYWVAGLPHDLVLDSFGLRFEQIENLRQYLRNGYFSWDGSYYVQPDTLAELEGADPRLERGYGMCQLLPRYGHPLETPSPILSPSSP
jgi:alpha-galactosidase